MAREVHYVLVVDLETGEVEIDNDTAIARFDEKLLWDTDTQEWREETEDEANEAYTILRNKLDN
jgi:hypothetical protein